MEQNAKENFVVRNKKYLWVEITTLVVIIALLGYARDYRLGSDFIFGKLGKVTVEVPFAETYIYVDKTEKLQTSKENEKIELKLSPTIHSFIISRSGYLPWTKDVRVPSGGSVTLSPIFISQNTHGEIITVNDKEYWKIKNIITNDVLPTKDSPKISSDKLVSILVQDNTIVAKVGNGVVTVIKPQTKIRNLDFYKNRSDYLVFSTDNTVYVVEINSKGTQNFMPVYKGTKPSFVNNNISSIYVLDKNVLMLVSI